MKRNDKKSRPLFLVGLLLGGAAGGVAAAVLAPKSGKQLRDDIGKQGNAIKDHAENIVLQVRSTAEAVTKRQ